MKKKVFLDTNVFVSLIKGDKDTKKLLSMEVRKKVELLVSSIVVQELVLFLEKMRDKKLIPHILDLVKVVPIYPEELDPKSLKKFRNLLMHTNDILILESAISEKAYLVTLDKDLLALNKDFKKSLSVEIISPKELNKLIRVTK